MCCSSLTVRIFLPTEKVRTLVNTCYLDLYSFCYLVTYLFCYLGAYFDKRIDGWILFCLEVPNLKARPLDSKPLCLSSINVTPYLSSQLWADQLGRLRSPSAQRPILSSQDRIYWLRLCEHESVIALVVCKRIHCANGSLARAQGAVEAR
jgi:hypothetical protein